MRKLLLVLMAVAACTPSPDPSTTLPPTQTPASATPRATTTPPPTTAPTQATVELPAGFDAIPWAHLPIDAATDSFTVAIGVLGKPSTASRTSPTQPTVWADGRAVLIDVGGPTEIVDAATGQTFATFDRDAMEFDGVPEDLYFGLSYRFKSDVERGFLYLMSSNRDGVQLRRFDLDGSHETRLAILAPYPGRQHWLTDFTLGPSGEVLATACPTDPGDVADYRCRLYEAAPGADGPIAPRFLPSNAPRPCALMAATGSWLIGFSYERCGADGGGPVALQYFALDLETLRTRTALAESEIRPLGAFERDGEPVLVGNLGRRGPLRSPYPAVAVELGFGLGPHNVGELFVSADYPDDPALANAVWALRGWAPDWSLLHAFPPAFAACMAGHEFEASDGCPSGPDILTFGGHQVRLPPGTFGEIVPPLNFPAF